MNAFCTKNMPVCMPECLDKVLEEILFNRFPQHLQKTFQPCHYECTQSPAYNDLGSR